MTIKTSARLTLHDRLSHLSFSQAARFLGPEGPKLLTEGGRYEIDIDEQVALGRDAFRLSIDAAAVTVSLDPSARSRIRWECDTCEVPCEHAGAAFSLILEEKSALGLAAPPPEREPVERLDDEALVTQALVEREERAKTGKMRVVSMDPAAIWTDYTVTNAASGKTYRVALRGWERGDSYCSCPDFRKNTLGTCKHILHALGKLRRRFPAEVRKRPYRRRGISVHLRYGESLEAWLLLPKKLDAAAARIVRPIRDRPIADFPDLLPYQLDGIAFAAGAGRAVLADDMGLGKTVQAIGLAELLARESGIAKVLIVCPASVKSQWRSEIRRFSTRASRLVLGAAAERPAQYGAESFFTICNYEQVLRDVLAIERVRWDLIVLDEGQRIKNWEAKTTQTIKCLRSPFALVRTGTPLENRLDDLFSIVEFIDDRRLGPAFRFFNRHRVVDEKGKVLGYRDLDALRENLKPVLLRRTRAKVIRDLPPRTTEVVRISPTAEQADLDGAQMQVVSTIVRKSYISEMDLLRLQKALLLARMNADSTVLVDKQAPGYSSKLERLEELFEELLAEDGRKIVLFSEWTTMLGLIEQRLERFGVRYVRLDGSVPQKKRQQLVHGFQRDPECRLFLTTNAGATGLNLQAADTVINVDLPWNPAVLEQRIARAHRMGQKRPVQVYLLVTESTIEEKLLATLSAKHDLALAALDMESDVREVALVSGIEELKRRLEVLLGAKPDAPVDASEQRRQQEETERLAQRARVAEAGGQLVAAAFAFLGQVLPRSGNGADAAPAAKQLKARLDECLERDEQGRPRLTVTLPDDSSLDELARSLAVLLGGSVRSLGSDNAK
jgi:superfamily II DNA or RNA helicase